MQMVSAVLINISSIIVTQSSRLALPVPSHWGHSVSNQPKLSHSGQPPGLFRLSLTQWTLFGQYFGTITSGTNLAIHKIAIPLVNCPPGSLCPHFGCQRKGWAERKSPISEISISPAASGGERECKYINVGL